MSTFNWKAIKERAKDGGFDPNPLEDGKYALLQVKSANFNAEKGRFGFLLAVVGGPDDGRTVWANPRVPTGNEKKAAATAAMFLKTMTALGVELSDGDPEADAKKAIGNYVSCEVKTNDAGFQNVNNIRKVAGPEILTASPAPEPEVQQSFDSTFDIAEDVGPTINEEPSDDDGTDEPF